MPIVAEVKSVMADMVHLAGRKYAIHLYRNMLKSAQKLQPQKRRDEAIESLKEGFRLNAGEADSQRVRAPT